MADCTHENTWFDRNICPEPCGQMHYICEDCGQIAGTCVLESKRVEMSTQDLVFLFHEQYGIPIGKFPKLPEDDLRDVRYTLMDSECEEYFDAEQRDDLAHIVQELADVVTVAYGTALSYGVDLDAVIREVMRANMTKDVNPDGPKPLKGSRFTPAEVEGVLQGPDKPRATHVPL